MAQMAANPEFHDHFEVLEKLGEGGFGVVMKVKEKQTGKIFAMKESRINSLSRADEREIESLKKVGSHPNVVHLVDVFRNDKVRIILEYCELGSLEDFVMKQNIWGDKMAQQMCDMATGVEYLHEKGVIHRDIKPANILLTMVGGRPLCKIADFGIAKVIESIYPEVSSHGYKYHSTDCGTVYYMAQEVFEKHYTESCDIFSLGAVFFVLYSKQKTGSNNLAPTINSKLLCAADDSDVRKAVDRFRIKATYGEMLKKMLKHDYHARPTASEVRKTFSHMSHEISIRTYLQYVPVGLCVAIFGVILLVLNKK